MKLLTFTFLTIFSFISLVNSADDPFYKNLEKEAIKRHDLSNTCALLNSIIKISCNFVGARLS